MIRSMTGFAETSGTHGETAWVWTLRSVNAKGLDLKLRMPPGYEAAEVQIRRADLPVSRGTVSATLKVDRAATLAPLRVDPDALAAAASAAKQARRAAKRANVKLAKTRPENLLMIGGVLRSGPEEREGPSPEEVEAIVAGFTEATAQLAKERAREGASLRAALSNRLDQIGALTELAEREGEAMLPTLRDRLRAQVTDLLGGDLPEDRVAQEAALLAVKADVREETDRLRAHAAAAREHLGTDGPVGRKLEFLAQEFAREANTLTAKAATLPLKQAGLDLKLAVDQVREQVLNVE